MYMYIYMYIYTNNMVRRIALKAPHCIFSPDDAHTRCWEVVAFAGAWVQVDRDRVVGLPASGEYDGTLLWSHGQPCNCTVVCTTKCVYTKCVIPKTKTKQTQTYIFIYIYIHVYVDSSGYGSSNFGSRHVGSRLKPLLTLLSSDRSAGFR